MSHTALEFKGKFSAGNVNFRSIYLKISLYSYIFIYVVINTIYFIFVPFNILDKKDEATVITLLNNKYLLQKRYITQVDIY